MLKMSKYIYRGAKVLLFLTICGKWSVKKAIILHTKCEKRNGSIKNDLPTRSSK